ncbi:MAG: beta-galactosidase, partial [Bacteroidales bacterium]|nr:beta-galactosidase [Bacteroidales bacterium]
MKRLFASVFILSLSTVLMAQQAIDLSGQWSFKTGGDDIPEEFVETVSLPGSMLVNGKGDEITDKTPWMMSINEGNPYYTDSYYARYRQPGNVKIPFTLQPEKYYQGIAWYQREIVIPVKFRNHVIKLFMERCHWETEVYVDGRKAGIRNDLCSPQEYDLTGYLAPGRHVLSIKVDNR